MKQEKIDVKRMMMDEAKEYANVYQFEGLTVNNPEKYRAFRDGQDSGYKIAMEQVGLKEVLEGILAEYNDPSVQWSTPIAYFKYFDQLKNILKNIPCSL